MRSVWRRPVRTRRTWSPTRATTAGPGSRRSRTVRGRPASPNPDPGGVLRWQGDIAARRAVYNNRARLSSGVGKAARRLRAERVERSFEHTLDRGGMRRAHLRGRANLQKRYLIHVAAFNLGLVIRLLLRAGTPKELAARGGVLLWLILPKPGVVVLVFLPARPPQAPLPQRAVRGDRIFARPSG